MGSLRILHTNDLHGGLTPARRDVLLKVRPDYDLWLDTGDAIKAGNLSLPLRPDPVWEAFAEGGLTAFCPGNRESHVWVQGVEAKFRGCSSPVLCSNWRRKDGSLVWLDSLIVEVKGWKVGLFGVMVPIVTAKMKTQAASHYLWDQPIPQAVRAAQALRPQVDLLLALTHIGFTQDQKLAEACPEIDLILGGHSHSLLSPFRPPLGPPLVQGGSHGRFLGSHLWQKGEGLVESSLIPWA